MVFTKACPHSELSLNTLRLRVSLGCTAEERSVLQYVHFHVKVRFPVLPEGCYSDRIEDTVCYAALSQRLGQVCEEKPYHLIEKLGWDAFQSIKKIIPEDVRLWLKVTKEKPPVPFLEQGTSFSVGDWEAS